MADKELEHKHDFDGIEEKDNDLPRWWLGIFWVTILFSLLYVPYYHFYKKDELPAAAWDKDQMELAATRKAAEAATPAEAGEAVSAAVEDEAALLEQYQKGGWEEQAKGDFGTFCVPCHGPDGGGTIGPNFTDDFYIHGGQLSQIRHVIAEGVPEKGMVSWKVQLKPDQIKNLAFYVRSMRGKTAATPKAAEGKKVDEAGNFVE